MDNRGQGCEGTRPRRYHRARCGHFPTVHAYDPQHLPGADGRRMRYLDTHQCGRRVKLLSAVEGHSNADEVHTPVHLWHKILGLCDCGVFNPRHRVLLPVVELPSGTEAAQSILQYSGIQG